MTARTGPLTARALIVDSVDDAELWHDINAHVENGGDVLDGTDAARDSVNAASILVERWTATLVERSTAMGSRRNGLDWSVFARSMSSAMAAQLTDDARRGRVAEFLRELRAERIAAQKGDVRR